MAQGIDDLLRCAVEKKASDLHLKVGNHPYVRIDGTLVPQTDVPRVTPEEMLSMAFSMMTNRQKQKFKETAELDMAYGVAGLGRFRVNVFQQRGNVGMVLRVIPTKIRTIDELNLPHVIETICEEQRGLVLVTGTTGSGKSTTLASMVDRINTTRSDHVITIEDPIEFLHRDKRSFINQREVEVDTANFSTALRAALRQDPDVILVGEMRDLETIATALLAAETGHLVFSTLHTLDATETIQRIIAVFPPPEQKQIRLQLAATLKAVISQRLVRCADDKGRVPAVEVMIATAYIRDCIINPEKTRLIHDAIAAGTSQYGMQTFDQSLYDLYTRNLITFEEALSRASNPDDFKLRVQGIRSAADAAREEMERTMAEYEQFGQPELASRRRLRCRFPQKLLCSPCVADFGESFYAGRAMRSAAAKNFQRSRTLRRRAARADAPRALHFRAAHSPRAPRARTRARCATCWLG